jgi:hypothetical protein
VTLVTITALLLLGAVTVRTMRAEIGAGGRFPEAALYVAESGVSAGIEALRMACRGEPPAIAGNGARPGEAGNLFDLVDRAAASWYEVTIAGGRIRSVGYGPGRASATVEVEVEPREGCAFAVVGWRQIF